MLRSKVLLVVAVMIVPLMPSPGNGRPAAAAGAAHLRWAHQTDGFLTESAVFDVNGDGAADVITASGDRDFYWWFLFPPGNPMAGLSQVKNRVSSPATGLRALDGATGHVLWEVAWQPETSSDEKNVYDFLDGLELADLNGDGKKELLVLRASHGAEGNRSVGLTYHTTAHDPTTGDVLWERRDRYGPDRFSRRQLQVLGPRGPKVAFVTAIEPSMKGLPRTRVELLRFSRQGPPRSMWKLPPRRGWMFTDAASHADRLDLYLSRFDTVPAGEGSFTVHRGEVEALRFSSSASRPRSMWRKPGAAGRPVRFVGGRRPVVLVGADELHALDAETGRARWSADIGMGLFSPGAIESVDVDADGQQDAVISPVLGSSALEAMSEIVALDGRNGSQLWSRLEPLGKFGAWSLRATRAGGEAKLIASLLHQDGFSFTGQYDDDPGLIAVYDLATGDGLCRFSTDHVARSAFIAASDEAGDLLFAPTVGGTTYGFALEEPACGIAAIGP